MTAIVLRADAGDLPLEDESVDLICTSPPYWRIRDYRDAGKSLGGQIGNEPTPQEYVAALLDCTREWMRVLKPAGSMFVNLGDKYSDRGHGVNRGRGTRRGAQVANAPQTRGPMEKSLLGLPWRYALGCLDDLGLTLRAEIVWRKVNGVPESANDRVRRSHEQVFHLVKQRRYFTAVDAIREPHAEVSIKRAAPHRADPGRAAREGRPTLGTSMPPQTFARDRMNHPLGRLPGSVWDISTQPLLLPDWLEVDHDAAFPMEVPRRIILGWSPDGICLECDAGRHPVSVVEHEWTGRTNSGRAKRQTADGVGLSRGFNSAGYPHTIRHTTITGYGCACPVPDAPTRPAVVLDPFGGTGTTALVADVLGRTGVSVDLSADYCRAARWRTSDPGERARALQVAKPPPVATGQAPLWGEDAS